MMKDVILGVYEEILASLLIFVFGFVVSRLPRLIRAHRLRRFFGSAVLTDDFMAVYGMYSRYSAEADNPKEPAPVLYEKRFHDSRTAKYISPLGRIITPEVIRAFSYVLQELARFRNRPVAILSDEEAVKILDNSFISIGGPAINEMTEWMLGEKTNRFFRFSIPDDPTDEKPRTIDAILDSTDQKFSFARNPGKDYGIVLKVKNSRFPGHFFFVCAGLGGWGTSGATWYLAKHWRELYREFGTDEFGIVLEVNCGSDTSAVRVDRRWGDTSMI